MLDGLHGAIQGGDDQVEAPEAIPLQLVELVLVMQACLGHQPNLPLT